jgi:hypothetical protein
MKTFKLGLKTALAIIPAMVSAEIIPLTSVEGGAITVPVTVNGTITVDFQVDSGAYAVLVPHSVFKTLVLTGKVQTGDIIGEDEAGVGNGDTVKTVEFKIRTLKIGNTTLTNVVAATIPGVDGPFLLGMSALSKIEPWSISTTSNTLTFNGNSVQPSAAAVSVPSTPTIVPQVAKPAVVTNVEQKQVSEEITGKWEAEQHVAFIKSDNTFVAIGFPKPEEPMLIFCNSGIAVGPNVMEFSALLVAEDGQTVSSGQGNLDKVKAINNMTCYATDISKEFMSSMKMSFKIGLGFKESSTVHAFVIDLTGSSKAMNKAYNTSLTMQ